MEPAKVNIEIGNPFIPYRTFPENNYLPVLDFLLDRQAVTWSEKEMLRILNKFSFKDGLCYPSQRRLESEIGLKNGQVRNILRSLEGKGLIRITRPNPLQRHLFRKHNSYKFLWHAAYSVYMQRIENIKTDTENTAQNDTGIYISPEVGKSEKKPVPVLSVCSQKESDAVYLPEIKNLTETIDRQVKAAGKRFDAAAFVGSAVKNSHHIEAVIEALKSVSKNLPVLDSPWAWANKILQVKSPNFHERDFVRQSEALKKEIRIFPEFRELLQGIG